MPKIVDSDRRRREIADKAVSVFAREGYRDANLSAIAGLCGFGRTTIYKYFRDKDDIFLFVIDQIFGRFEASSRAVLEHGSRDAVAKIEALFETMVRDSMGDRDRMLIVLDLLLRLRRDDISVSAGVRDRVAGLRRFFELALSEGMAAGQIERGDAPALASALFAIVETFVLQQSLFDSLSYERSMAAARRLVEGLRARPA